MLSDGFEPSIFALQVQRLTNLAIRALTSLPIVETGFEPAKHTHCILSATPLTARELYLLIFL
jgi:hypothetical protein